MESSASADRREEGGNRKRKVSHNAEQSERARKQNADRQRAHRDAERKKREDVRTAALAAVAVANREIGQPRYRGYGSLENIEWVVRVGCTPSAGGARAPLADIINHVACRSTSRWSVELYRWRTFGYILQKETELVAAAIAAGCFGLKLSYDETPCRLFCQHYGGVLTMSVQVRCVSLYGLSSRLFCCVPRLGRPESGSAESLFAALAPGSIPLAELCADSLDWRFVLSTPDAARANSGVARRLVAHCERFPRLLVAHGTCYAHILSNATRWALGRDFLYGAFVRISHVLQARATTKIDGLRAASLSDVTCDAVGMGERDLFGLEVWDFFLRRFLAPFGPFEDFRISDVYADRLALCHSLWPTGFPIANTLWCRVNGRLDSEYDSALKMLFKRTVQTPLASRWYSIESFSWYLLGARSFGLLAQVFRGAVAMKYWPGDDPSEMLENSVGYAAESKARVDRAAKFVESSEFLFSIFAAAVSSVPRWAFARLMSRGVRRDNASGAEVKGITAACDAFFVAANEILGSDHAVINFTIDREPEQHLIRMRCYVAISVSALYLAERHRPFTSTFWKIVRGEQPPADILSVLEASTCCAETGTTRKIQTACRGLSADAQKAVLSGLLDTLAALSSAYVGAEGSHNMVAESAFSVLRSLALKTPYRPVKLCTAERELVLRHVRICHRQWYQDYVIATYGSLRTMHQTLTRPSAKFNGFTCFCRYLFLSFAKGRPLWKALPPAQRRKWGDIACRLNRVAEEAKRAQDNRPGSKPGVGPWGSSHRWIPISASDVQAKLTAPAATLRGIWSRDGVRRLKDGLCGRAASDPRENPPPGAVLLPGDRCGPCMVSKNAERRRVAGLFDVLNRCYVANGGESVGAFFGFVYEDCVLFFDVLLILRNPRRVLAFKRDIATWRDYDAAGLGPVPYCFYVGIPPLFDGRSFCVLSFCADRGLPSSVWWFEKFRTVSLKDGWMCTLTLKRERIDYDLPRTEHVSAPGRKRTGKHVVGLVDFAHMFGDLDDDIPGDSFAGNRNGEREEGDVKENESLCASDVSLADLDPEPAGEEDNQPWVAGSAESPAVVSASEHLFFAQQVSSVIDCARYAVVVRPREGVVTAYWRDSEKTRHREAYLAARRQLRQTPGSREMTSSKSSTLAKHGFPGCLERAAAWAQWHTAWVYRVQPSRALLPGMTLPSGVLLISHTTAAHDCLSASDGDGESSATDNVLSEAASSSDVASTSLGSDFSGGG